MAAPIRQIGHMLRNVSFNYRYLPCVTAVEKGKLFITPLNCARPYCSDDNNDVTNKKNLLDLAKPPRKSKSPTVSGRNGEDTVPSELGTEIMSAAKDVAQSLEGDSKSTLSDLISKLKDLKTTDARVGDKSSKKERTVARMLGNVVTISSMRDSTRRRSRPRLDNNRLRRRNVGEENTMKQSYRLDEQKTYSRADHGESLFKGPTLQIYTDENGNPTVDLEGGVKHEETYFDVLEREKLEKEMRLPPSNAFEEMSRWTKEGKMWSYPLNNEEGLDEEAKVPFYEHVFLDHLIEDFPKKGPVRVFMELVINGLSKNPYMTVQEKKDHVDWFRKYFEEKKPILAEALKEQNLAQQKELQ